MIEHLQIYLKRKSYSKLFLDDNGYLKPEAKDVLEDLAQEAGAVDSNIDVDSHIMAFREGRREIFNRIVRMLKMNFMDVHQLVNEEEDNERNEYAEY